MQAVLGAEWPAFQAALSDAPPVSLRANAAKWSGPAQHDGQVPWCLSGYYLSERPVFTLDPLLHAGAYYVQEASSMFVAEALRQTLDLSRPLLALDLAAAPGGKSTLIAGMLSADSLLIANEVIRSRYNILRHNLVRWGLPNVAISNHDPGDFAPLAGRFDLVLTDAPCSGEGLFRKDPDAMREWSPQQVSFCAARQRRILTDAVRLLAPGGVLVYSTCTYNFMENEENAEWLQTEAGLEYIPLVAPASWNIAESRFGCRFYPNRVRGEGFYLVCFRKQGGKETPDKWKRTHALRLKHAAAKTSDIIAAWLKHPAEMRLLEDAAGRLSAIPVAAEEAFFTASAALYRIEPILELGEVKQGELIPAPALALNTALSGSLPSVDLDKTQALRYLRKEDPQLPQVPHGWILARYENLPLGWMKGLANRVNNYFPKEWRILMREGG